MSFDSRDGAANWRRQDRTQYSPSRTPVSPISATASTASLHQAQYGRPITGGQVIAPQRSVSPIKHRGHAFEDIPPPPPKHRSKTPSNTKAPQQNFGNMLRPGHVNYAAPVTGLEGSGPFNSGSQTLRDIDNLYGGDRMLMSPSLEPVEDRRFAAPVFDPATPPRQPTRPTYHQLNYSASSTMPLMKNLETPPIKGSSSPRRDEPVQIPLTSAGDMGAYSQHHTWQPRRDGYGEDIDPDAIIDNGDDGFEELPRAARSMKRARVTGADDEEGGFRVFSVRHRNASANYGAVSAARPSYDDTYGSEKRDYQHQRPARSGRRKWLIGLIALIVIAAIAGGTVGGILASKKLRSGGSSNSASPDSSSSSNSDSKLFDINSPQVQSLLDNQALHKVFPGMDYTPLNAQYPACLTSPPSQNNITLDLALLSQLTPSVRLYGTDCNQTEMVLTGIDRLGYSDTLQVWLGVWLGTNQTTNDRQLEQMYSILRTYPAKHFAGIIVGNEVLFREDMTIATLANTLTNVRSNLTALDISLPVATSDLGDDWTAALAQDSDIVMANVHPFFAGVKPDVAPGWTYEFWQTHNANLATASTNDAWPKSIISEVGWPSEGGNDCGTQDETCPSPTAGAVASIDNMNTFMDGFVCQSLGNGTTFFWFEAFDEPWKHQFDTDTDKWESKWGLMDENRKVKDGLKIPDCGGKTVDKPY